MAVQEKAKSSTIYDIAKLAGVSPITVSRAFSRKLPVSEETRQKILKVADRLQFRPSPLASGLNGGKTNCISILWSPDFPILPQNISSDLMMRAHEKGFHLQLVVYAGDFNDILKECLHRATDAIIACAPISHLNQETWRLLKKFYAAVLIVDCAVECDSDLIVWDRTPGITEAVDHLKRIGKQKPCICMPVDCSKRKIDVFFNAAFDNGFTIDKSSVIDVPLAAIADIEKFEMFFEQYLDNNKFSFDAVLFLNDEMAFVAMRLLQQKGYSIPNQIAVVGFNDDTIARIASPKLASINRNHEELGRQMEDMVFARLENPKLTPQVRKVDMRFVHRESTLGKV